MHHAVHRPSMIALLALGLLAPALQAAEFDCLLEPRRIVELRSPANGLIERMAAERGQFVQAGQVLMVLDSGYERASLTIARQKATMDGAVRSGQSRLEYATIKFKRRDDLVAERFISQQDRDEAATERNLAEAELQDANDNRRLAQLEVRRTEEQIRLRTLVSPIPGVVMERNGHAGELADSAGERKPLFRIADIAVLHAEAILPAEVYAQVKVGSTGTIIADTPVKVRAQGTVKVVDRVLDAASGTFGVRLEVPNPGLDLPAGIQCRVNLPAVKAASTRERPPPVKP